MAPVRRRVSPARTGTPTPASSSLSSGAATPSSPTPLPPPPSVPAIPERFDTSAQAALVTVFRNMFTLDNPTVPRESLDRLDGRDPAQALLSLADCAIFGCALEDLDPDFHPQAQFERAGPGGGPSQSLQTAGNLIVLLKGVFSHIRRNCRNLMRMAKYVDILAIAKNPDEQAMAQVVALLISVAVLVENNRRHVEHVFTIEDQDVKVEIMRIVKARQAACALEDPDEDPAEILDRLLATRDIDLAREEERALILADLETSRRQNSDLYSRLERLQAEHDVLVEESRRAQDEVARLQDSSNRHGDLQFLQKRLEEADGVIESQEAEIQALGEKMATLTTEMHQYQRRLVFLLEVEDRAKELGHQNVELSKKANAAERYKQKLEAQHSLATENQNLQFERASLQRDYDDVVSKLAALEDGLAMYRQRDGGQTLAVAAATREAEELRIDVINKEEELVRLRGLKDHDDRVIYELQEQIRNIGLVGPSSGVGTGPTSPTFGDQGGAGGGAGGGGGLMSLDQELRGAAEAGGSHGVEVGLAVENSRLRADIELQRSTRVPAEEVARIRNERDSEARQCEDLRRENSALLEKHAYQQQLVRDLLSNASGEGSVRILDKVLGSVPLQLLTGDFYRTKAYSDLNARFETAKAEGDRRERVIAELTAELADARRAFAMTESSMSTLSQSDSDALETFQQTQLGLSASLRDELELSRQANARAMAELARAKADLLASEQGNEQLRRGLDEAKELYDKFMSRRGIENEMAEMDSKSGSNEWTSRAWADLSQRTEQNHELLKKLKSLRDRAISTGESTLASRSQQQNDELLKKIVASQDGNISISESTLASKNEKIRTLQRELAVITSAWYDLTARMQSNHVVLQRRTDGSKSWIGRQRQMVNATTPRK